MSIKPLDKFGRGFTIIEVLVVVAIVTILAGLLLPALARAREAGKRTVCLNNLSQMARAMQMYVQDHNQRFPPVPPNDPMDPSAGPTGEEGWALTIADSLRIKKDSVFQCPTEEKPFRSGFTDYWINDGLQGISEVKVQSSASVILIGDGSGDSVDYALGATVEKPWLSTASYATRHLGGANYLFVDGHVKWLHPDQISTTDAPNGSNFTFVIG